MLRRLLVLLAVCLVLYACDKSTDPKYTIPLPTFTPSGGTYFSVQFVQINSTVSNVTIRYTLDGTDPTTNSPIYTTPIGIAGATTIKAKAYKNKMKPSNIAQASYSFNVGSLYMNPPSGSFTQAREIEISASSAGSVIHYTINGAEPNEESPIYSSPITIDGNTTLKAKGYIAGWNPSETKTASYTFNVTQPTFSIDPGTYYNTFNVVLASPTNGASIHYTTDGSEPTEASALYINEIAVNNSKTIKAKAFKDNYSPSPTATAAYVLKATVPAFNPNAGVYYTPQEVSITSPTPETKIYYTTDGSNPTTSSTLYSSPLTLSLNTNLKAIAYRSGWTSSNITNGSYTFYVSTPVLNPTSGLYSGAQTITITCDTPEANIRYTTNNTDPISTSTLYTEPISITTNTTLKVRSFKTGMYSSQIVTANYQITNAVASPVFNPPGGIYYEPQQVTITCTTPGAEIRYTLDGTDPNSGSPLFYYPIDVDAGIEIRARAYKPGWIDSPIVTEIYQFDTHNQIVAWGSNTYNQCNVPPGDDFAVIEAGMYHTVGLRTDGSLVAWGRNNFNQCDFPAGNNYVAISAGDNHCLALKVDGSIVAWGRNDSLQCEIPPDSLGYTYTAIAAGGNHSLALKSDGTLIAWGANSSGQCEVPDGNTFVNIAAGSNYCLALRANGSLVAWGNNDNGQINCPTGTNYADIAAGDQHCVAKRLNNSLIGWGSNSSNQATAPGGTNFSKVAAGYRHNIALKTDGTLATWGYSGNGLGVVPTATTYIDVAAGRDFSVVLKASAATDRKMKLKSLKPKFKLK